MINNLLNNMLFTRLSALIVLFMLALQAIPASAAEGALGVGLPGPGEPSNIQVAEMRVSYRLDQMGAESKEQSMVPVQTTIRLHNTGNAETLELGIPLPEMNGQAALITAIYVNGHEVPANKIQNFTFADGQSMRTALVAITVLHEADAIVDVRMLEPQNRMTYSFLLSTGSGWKGPIISGSVEGIFNYDVAAWNTVLRRAADGEALPMKYSGRSATWEFTDLDAGKINDVEWHSADGLAMDLFMRGNERWTKTQGDAKSYAMMRDAMLDMIPCNGRLMPLKTWWQGMYDTMTMGVIATTEPQNMQDVAALELWSAGWQTAAGEQAECITLKQRSERYKAVLERMLATEPAQRDAETNNALKNHYEFLHKLSADMGDNSLAGHEDKKTDPYGNAALSERDKQLLKEWDQRFAAQNGQARADRENTSITAISASAASSTLNRIKNIFPNLSTGTQTILFSLCFIILLVIIGLVILRWKDSDEPPAYNKLLNPTAPTASKSPSFIPPPVNMPADNKPWQAGLNADNKISAATLAEKKSEIVAPTQPYKKFEPAIKPEIKKGQLDEAYTAPKPKVDAPWIKQDKQAELIKPQTPPPATPAPNNVPWQIKKDNNEQTPGPTVNI